MSIKKLTDAYAAYEAARIAAEEPGGVFDFSLCMTFRAPTPEEYAGYQVVRYGSPEAALAAMQRQGRQVDENYMDAIGRRAAAMIAAAMKADA